MICLNQKKKQSHKDLGACELKYAGVPLLSSVIKGNFSLVLELKHTIKHLQVQGPNHMNASLPVTSNNELQLYMPKTFVLNK